MTRLSTFEHLLIREMRDLYNAERQVVKALPRMVKAANSVLLKRCFEEHREDTLNHVVRIEEAMSHLGTSPHGKSCNSIKCLINEVKITIREDGIPPVKDASLILVAQQIGYYEMAGYGAAKTLAYVLGHDEVASLLYKTHKQEIQNDERLTDLAVMLYTESDMDEPDPELHTLAVKT